jgi:transposase
MDHPLADCTYTAVQNVVEEEEYTENLPEEKDEYYDSTYTALQNVIEREQYTEDTPQEKDECCDSAYNALQNMPEREADSEHPSKENDDYYDEEKDETDFRVHRQRFQYHDKPKFESFDFTVSESIMWRKVSYIIISELDF